MLSLKDFKEVRIENVSKLNGGAKKDPTGGGSTTETTATGCTFTRKWTGDYTDDDGFKRYEGHTVTWGAGCGGD